MGKVRKINVSGMYYVDEIPNMICGKCGKPLQFDENPDDFKKINWPSYAADCCERKYVIEPVMVDIIIMEDE